jgi:hypothetical protein
MRSILIALATACLALAASGCASSDPAPSTRGEDPKAVADLKAATQQTDHAAQPRDSDINGQVRRYIRENFGPGIGQPTSWYGDIERYIWSFGTVTVRTDLYPDSDATAPATAICAAVLGARSEISEVEQVKVTGQHGKELHSC